MDSLREVKIYWVFVLCATNLQSTTKLDLKWINFSNSAGEGGRRGLVVFTAALIVSVKVCSGRCNYVSTHRFIGLLLHALCSLCSRILTVRGFSHLNVNLKSQRGSSLIKFSVLSLVIILNSHVLRLWFIATSLKSSILLTIKLVGDWSFIIKSQDTVCTAALCWFIRADGCV